MKKLLLSLFILFTSIHLGYGQQTGCSPTFYACVGTPTAAGSITATSATTSFTWTSWNWTTSYSLLWSTSPSPTVGSTPGGGNITTAVGATTSSSTGTLTMTGLSASTTYYVRGYAFTASGVGYSADMTFTTASGLPPSVTTTASSSVTGNGAVAGGTPSNASPVSEGVVYAPTATSATPVVPTHSFTSNGTSSSAYVSTMTGLLANTAYSYRAYIEQPAGTYTYGAVLTFTTSTPSVTTTTATAIASSSATSGGTPSNITSAISKGVVWGAAANPTMPSASSTSDGTTSAAYSSSITGLTPGTTYHYRSYVQTSTGVYVYGADNTFLTLSPSVTTTVATAVTGNGASSGGTPSNVASTTAQGVVWGAAANPTMPSANSTSNGTTGAVYTSSISGLAATTTYHYRAYILVSGTYYYGADLTFTTLAPSVTTTVASSVTGNGASTGGTPTNITAAVSKGVVWGAAVNPTMPSANSTSDGTTSAAYTSTITGLAPATTYHYRAYVEVSAGVYVYGADNTFLTLTPSVTTTVATGIIGTGATSGGTPSNITSATAKGVVWGAAANPTMPSANSTSDGTTSAAYASSITGLTVSTTYHYRAYILVSGTYYYGADLTFTTAAGVPSVTTTVATGISSNGATSGGTPSNVASTTAQGVVWGAAVNPTMPSANSTSDGTTGAVYSSTISGLASGTLYHYRAYILVSGTYYYGADATFTTNAGIANGTLAPTAPVINIVGASATSSGNSLLTWSGSADITDPAKVGLVWSTAAINTATDPLTQANYTVYLHSSIAGSVGAFPSSVETMTGLTCGTTYNVMAYARTPYYPNKFIYSTNQTFTSAKVWLTTTAASSVTNTTASSGGNITAACGGVTVSSRGVCYSTSTNPTTSNSTVVTGSGTGVYVSGLTGLIPNTTYYLKAYAVGSDGVTYYGDQVNFTTTSPSITTAAITQLTITTATSGGSMSNVISPTVKGVVWNTTGTPTTADSKTTDGAGAGAYSSSLTGLTSPGTTYYIRAYIIDGGITYYGNQITYTTYWVPVAGAVSPYSISPKWMFGYKTGLNFNTGVADGASFKVGNPVYFGGNPTLDTNMTGPPAVFTHDLEGSSTICDSADNVALYCNSAQIFDKNNNAITNMSDDGYNSASCTDGSIIIPDPVNPFNVYHFFLGNDESSGNASYWQKGMLYYKIDKTGGVITGPINLDGGSRAMDESLCASSDSVNGYWIISRNQGNGRYMRWHLLNTGALESTTPVLINTTGMAAGSQTTAKISQCQDKIAWTGGSGQVEVYKWIKSKGTVGALLYSGSVPVAQRPSIIPSYGLEFSPDGTKLYQSGLGYSYGDNDGTLNQLDLNTNTWGSSKLYTGSINGDNEIGTMQIGPNGKIYVSMKSDATAAANAMAFYVGAIENPNVAQGSGLVFNPTAVKIKDANSGSRYPGIGRGIANIPWLNPKTQAATATKIAGGCRRYRLTNGLFSYFRDKVTVVSATWTITNVTTSAVVVVNGTTPFETIDYDFPTDDAYDVYCVTQDATCGEIRRSNTFRVTPNCALPVEFINISAVSQAGSTKVYWSTAVEINSASFTIQRSVNGRDFSDIGTVASSGNSKQIKNYSFQDANPLDGIVYYRVVENAGNGEKIYSSIVSTESQSDGKIYTISNNPFKSEFNLNIIGERNIKIDIFEVGGKLVFSNKLEDASGSISLGADLSSGMYILEVIDEATGKVYRDKLLKN